MNSFENSPYLSHVLQTGMDIEGTAQCLQKFVTSLEGTHKTLLDIPLRADGSEYRVEDLADDQKAAMVEVISQIKDYCENKLNSGDQTLRLTVSGVAGSGKSTWINTLVTLIRRLFQDNDSIGVYGPTGSAAFNAGGETINRGFRVPINVNSLGIDGVKEKFLLKKYGTTIGLIIDERSMLEADKLGCVQHYMTQCAHHGLHKDKLWGGIPIIILVGDDYQLPSIGYGAFYALEGTAIKEQKNPRAAQIAARVTGFEEFRKFGKNVVYLDGGVKRVNKDQDQLRRILKGLRCENDWDTLTEEDIQRLLALDINHESFTKKQREEIEASSMYLFANKDPRDAHNAKMLWKANQQGNPVARIRSKTESSRTGKPGGNASHFDTDRTPAQVLLCKTARVALNGVNISPGLGLYHGSIGTVEDIVYKNDESPKLGDQPAYVLVNFYQYCGKQLLPSSKHSVPIVPTTVRCKIGCCVRTYMPLSLAYGKTVHTFQGQSVGPVPPGRPENAIQRIIVEPGNRQFEGNNVGLFYTTASRPTTIGTPDNKLSSAIYFDGPDFSRKRITNLTRDNSGKLYRKAQLRQAWVKYMKNNSQNRRQYTKAEMEHLFAWVAKTRYTNAELQKIIEINDKK